MNTVLVLLQKEIALYMRDKTAVALTFLVPFAIIVIVGNIFAKQSEGGGLQSEIVLAVHDESGSPSAERLVEALEADPGIDVLRENPGDAAEQPVEPFDSESIRAGIENHRYNFALVIPPDFVKGEGVGVRLTLLSNPRNEVEAQIVNGLIQKAVFTSLPQTLASQLDAMQREAIGDERYEAFVDGLAGLVSLTFDELSFEEARENMGLSGLAQLLEQTPGGEGQGDGEGDGLSAFFSHLLEIEEDQVFGKEVRNPYLTRIIGGYAIMFLLFATTGSATSLFEERNEGLFQRLLSMPATRAHILWSKYLFNTLLGVVQVQTLFIASSLLFDVGVFASYFRLFLVSVLAASACTAFGMLLASVSKTPQQAQGLGTLLIISMSAIGGAWFPVSWMPELMQAVSKLTLVYWGVEGFLKVLWEDAGLGQMLPTLGVIAAYSAALLAVSLWRFRVGDLLR